MKRLGLVMVRCPKTRRELSTGIEIDSATLGAASGYSLDDRVPCL